MKVSIVVPIYNVEKYLRECIDSILKQDILDYEIILVDDGSPDNCPAICDEYAARDDRIKVVHKQNGGLSSARNAGIRESSGDYLIFMDSDDFWNDKVSVADMFTIVENNKQVEMFLFSSLDYIEGKGYFKRKEHFNLKDFQTDTVEDYCKSLQRNGNFEVAAYTKIFRTDFIKNNELFFKEGIVSEDSEWMLRVLRHLKTVKVIDSSLYIYRQREGSITKSIGKKNIYDLLGIVEDNLQIFSSSSSQLKEYILDYCSYLWFCALGLLYNVSKQDKKELKAVFKKTSSVCRYSSQKKSKTANLVYKLFGLNIASNILGIYIKKKNKNNFNMVKYCE